MVTLTQNIINELRDTDVICLEGFSYGSKGRGVSFQYGLGHTVRNELYKRDLPFTIVTPGQLKKYATGKGNTSKDNMILPIYKRWKYEHKSDNVRDAYVLAQIARSMKGLGLQTKYQEEITEELKKR